MKAVILHAYSSTNSGDGLLVEEALSILRESFPSVSVSLVALDPQSFTASDFESVIHPLSGGPYSISKLNMLRFGLTRLVIRGRPPRVRQLIAEADLVVGVGGGYLRAKDPVEAIKMGLTSFVQLPTSDDATPFVYLPQSIGPLRFGTLGPTARRLSQASAVMARDNRTIKDLSGHLHAARYPDMAILGLPDVWTRNRIGAGQESGLIGLVARDLASAKRTPAYRANLLELKRRLNCEWLIQANARGNNDPDFYASLGHRGPTRFLKEAVQAGTRAPSAVISVRLHGAIQSIRAGVPSVHLSYERKGWGAFEDLGLSQYVHNAFDFDVDQVVRQAASLSADATEYWRAVEGSLPDIRAKRGALVAQLRAAVDESSRC